MAANSTADEWLGLLKWSLSYQDGTAPSEARPMSDEDRQWLESVLKEGVKDEAKEMAQIFERLCGYLDRSQGTSSGSKATMARGPVQAQGRCDDNDEGTLGDPVAGRATVLGTPLTLSRGSGQLSLFVPTPPLPPAPDNEGETDVAEAGAGVGAPGVPGASKGKEAPVPGKAVGGKGGAATLLPSEEEVQQVVEDLEELRDIVEQVDMATTFVRIGGFGRLMALAGWSSQPYKVRCLAASVIATLTKNNPPAQAAFSSSGGMRAMIEVASTPTPATAGHWAMRRAALHAISCSATGNSAAEGALLQEEGLSECLERALLADLAPGEEEGGGGMGDGGGALGSGASAVQETREQGLEEIGRLRAKAAFLLKALVGAPGAGADRVNALWPALVAILTVLERHRGVGAVPRAGSVKEGKGEGWDNLHRAGSREVMIEAILAAARSAGGGRVLKELGRRVSAIRADRCTLLRARAHGVDENERVELGLWGEWEAVVAEKVGIPQ
ncbi:unnamed protein product [Discosporangium mesarthrocarpum]